MNIPFLDLRKQYKSLKPQLDHAYQEVMDSGWFIQGEKCRLLEQKTSAYYGVKHAVGVGNGTQAIELAIRALDLPMGSEVLVPAYGWISTAHAVVQAGHIPVFVDVNPGGLQMDPDLVGKLVTENTRVILPVHLFGEVRDQEHLTSMAESLDLLVIEDAAQAHGIKNIGKRSKAACLSFYPTKQLGAYGDAGMVLTNDSELAANIRKWANYGADFPERNYELPGTNSRLDELQAAFLLVKLDYLDNWIRRRREISSIYNEKLGPFEKLALPPVTVDHSFYLYTVRVEKRDELRSYLQEKGISTGLNYEYAIPNATYYASERAFPNAQKVAETILNLPCYPELTDEEIHYVCDAIKSYFTR